MSAPLWTRRASSRRGGRPRRRGASTRSPASPSTAARSSRAMLLRHQGRPLDGHDFVADGARRRARPARGRRGRLPALGRIDGPLARRRRRAGRARAGSAARRARRGRTPGSSPSPAASARPDQGDAARSRWPPTGRPTPRAASFNNHWGVPLTLARMPRDAALRRVRDRHEPRRRDHAAGQAGAAACRASSPRSSRCISNIFGSSRRSPTPRPRSSAASSRAARRSSTATTRITRGSRAPAKAAGVERVLGFGEHAEAEVRLRRPPALQGGLLAASRR